MKTPQDCTDMADIRAAIDVLDAQLVQLLAQRAGYIDRAGAIKAAANLPARITPRVDQVIANVRAHAQAQGLAPDLAQQLWQVLIEWSIAREEQILGQAEDGKDT